jgi:hypothetical protein
MRGVGGVGLAVDPTNEERVTFYAKYGFVRVEEQSLRMFLPLASLRFALLCFAETAFG